MLERAKRVNDLHLPRKLRAASIFDAGDRLCRCAVTATDRRARFS
jgi:hypothetical protein